MSQELDISVDISAVETFTSGITTITAQSIGAVPLDGSGKISSSYLPDQASLDSEVDEKVTIHNSDTTSVHGIANTANLATKTYADGAGLKAGVEWTANHTATNPYIVGSVVFYNHNQSGVTISGLTGLQSGYNGHYLFISRISGLALYRTSTGQTITQTSIYNGAGYLAGQFIWRLDGLGWGKWGPAPWGSGWSGYGASIPAQNAVETPSQGRVYKCIAQDSSQQPPVAGSGVWEDLGFGFLLPSENPKIVAGTINTQSGSSAGGTINTSDGGGSINTGGSGSIQFGQSGQRTTLVGSAVVNMSPHNHTITLPRATGTIALSDDSRFTDSRTPNSHTHGNLSNDGKVIVPYGGIISASAVDAFGGAGTYTMIQGLGVGGSIQVSSTGVITIATAGTGYVDGQAIRAGGSRFNLVTQATQNNASANLPIITTTGGGITTGSFGTTANSFCQGNDVRLSDARTPRLTKLTSRENIGSSTFYSVNTITDISKSLGATNNVVITTASPHNFNTNDIVYISGLQTSTAGTGGLANFSTLNGNYVVTAVTATTFTYFPNSNTALSTLYGAVPKLVDRIITKGVVGDMEVGNDYSTSADCLFVCMSTNPASVTSGTPLPVGVTSFSTWKKVALVSLRPP